MNFGPTSQFSDVRAVLGEVKDCLVVMDACSPASVWTRDGLYAGAFDDDTGISPAKDGWEALAFRKHHNDNQWGPVIETPAGDVLWGQMRDNSTPFYRITGWEHWERQQGQLMLKAPAAVARRKGTGLTGEYFASPDLTGKPVLSRVDPEIWLGAMRGQFRPFKAPPFRSAARELRKISPEEAMSARWTGAVEAPVSEDFTFRVYLYGQKSSGARVRLWIADKLVIDAWEEIVLEQFQTSWYITRELVSSPIPLEVGRLVPVRIEYSSPGGPNEHLHLYWESRSCDLRHVPKVHLYPGEAAARTSKSDKSGDREP